MGRQKLDLDKLKKESELQYLKNHAPDGEFSKLISFLVKIIGVMGMAVLLCYPLALNLIKKYPGLQPAITESVNIIKNAFSEKRMDMEKAAKKAKPAPTRHKTLSFPTQ